MPQVKVVAENNFPTCLCCKNPIDYGQVLVDSSISVVDMKQPLSNLVHVSCAWSYLTQKPSIQAWQLKQYELVR